MTLPPLAAPSLQHADLGPALALIYSRCLINETVASPGLPAPMLAPIARTSCDEKSAMAPTSFVIHTKFAENRTWW
jgi:hypothetical protein